MGLGQAIFANIASWVITLIISVVGKFSYEKFFNNGNGIQMSFFQMLLSIIGILVVANLLVWSIVYLKNKPDIAKTVLKDIANATKDKSIALYSFREYGNSGVPTNDTWAVWLKKFPASIGRADLDYYNLGNEFHLVDFSTGKEIPIPTGNKARTEKVGDTIHPGMVLRLMQKDG